MAIERTVSDGREGDRNLEDIPVLNYSTHAIEQLNARSVSLARVGSDLHRIYRGIAALLDRAEKFLLPERGESLDPSSLNQAHLDLLRLPFPNVALEASFRSARAVAGIGIEEQATASRRIALCCEAGMGVRDLYGLSGPRFNNPEGGVFVLPIFWHDAEREWTLSLGGVYVPYGLAARNPMTARLSEAAEICLEGRRKAGLASTRSLLFGVEVFTLPQQTLSAIGMSLPDRSRLEALILGDTLDEISMLLQTCAVLNCENVTSIKVAPPRALERARQRRGASPLYSYRVLTVPAQGTSPSNESGFGGAVQECTFAVVTFGG